MTVVALRVTRSSAWRAYALTALAATVLVAGIVSAVVSRASLGAVWFSAGLAYGLQLVAFAGLLVVRDQAHRFLLGWVLGMALRFGAVGGVAWWLSRSAAFPREATLLSLVAFVFVLLLMEPLFLRWDMRQR
jgi:hypothetical protein